MPRIQERKSSSHIDCHKCIRRARCASLCPAAEKYAQQDFKAQRELTISTIVYSKHVIPTITTGRLKFSPRDTSIITLAQAGVPRNVICGQFCLTRAQLRLIIHRVSRKLQRIREENSMDEGDSLLG
jgi:hypothetical protein